MFNFNYNEDMMKQWFENWEKMMGSSLEKMVNDDKFIGEMAKAVASTMSGKSLYKNAVDEQLKFMNLPTRTDIIKMMQKITDIEERLIDLTEKMEDYMEETEKKIDALIIDKTKPAFKAKPAVNAKKTVKKSSAKTAAKKTVKKPVKKTTKKVQNKKG